jgi:hypothetical protein
VYKSTDSYATFAIVIKGVCSSYYLSLYSFDKKHLHIIEGDNNIVKERGGGKKSNLYAGARSCRTSDYDNNKEKYERKRIRRNAINQI